MGSTTETRKQLIHMVKGNQEAKCSLAYRSHMRSTEDLDAVADRVRMAHRPRWSS